MVICYSSNWKYITQGPVLDYLVNDRTDDNDVHDDDNNDDDDDREIG